MDSEDPIVFHFEWQLNQILGGGTSVVSHCLSDLGDAFKEVAIK